MRSDLATLLVVSAGAFVVSTLTALLVIKCAGRLRLMDIPNDRSSHLRPTPRGGGLGIVAATIGGVIVLNAAGVESAAPFLRPLVFGGGAIAAISLVDDIRGVAPVVRLLCHFIVAIATVMAIGTINGLASSAVAVVWIVGMINAFNFMDGIDGLAGLQAVAAASFWVVLGSLMEWPQLVALGMVLGSSCLGFLVHNWPPAKVFLGDVGSAFLGFVLSLFVIVAAGRSTTLAVAGVVLVWPFVFDTTATIIRRSLRREDLTTAHRSHIYQRLVATGMGHSAVTRWYGLLALLAGVSGLLLASRLLWGYAVAVIYIVGTAVLLLTAVRSREAKQKCENE